MDDFGKNFLYGAAAIIIGKGDERAIFVACAKNISSL